MAQPRDDEQEEVKEEEEAEEEENEDRPRFAKLFPDHDPDTCCCYRRNSQ